MFHDVLQPNVIKIRTIMWKLKMFKLWLNHDSHVLVRGTVTPKQCSHMSLGMIRLVDYHVTTFHGVSWINVWLHVKIRTSCENQHYLNHDWIVIHMCRLGVWQQHLNNVHACYWEWWHVTTHQNQNIVWKSKTFKLWLNYHFLLGIPELRWGLI